MLKRGSVELVPWGVGAGVGGMSGPHTEAATLRRRWWWRRRMRGVVVASDGSGGAGAMVSAGRLFLPLAFGESMSIVRAVVVWKIPQSGMSCLLWA